MTEIRESLPVRMGNYENKDNYFLETNQPIIVRVDGSNFSKFTKLFKGTFNYDFSKLMIKTAEAVAKELPTCVFFTTHSDEISFFLCDYEFEKTQALFNGCKRKIESKVAGKVTREFAIQLFKGGFYDFVAYFDCFDARAFNLPKDEVFNYFLYRQNDGVRNSVQMFARDLYSQTELNKKSTIEMKEMLLEKELDWEFEENWKKYGYVGMKLSPKPEQHSSENSHKKWFVKEAEPLLTYRNDIEKLAINFKPELAD